MKKPCLDCGMLTPRTRCGACSRARERTRRPSPSRRGYDHEWSKFSAAARAAQPWCSRCGSSHDLTVDHIVPGLLDAGVRVLCRRCHGEIGAQSNRRSVSL